MKPEIISWLLEGDPSIRWQVQRDLLNASPAKGDKHSDLSGRKFFKGEYTAGVGLEE
jgi:hypothetical protein